jgi:hypothetical protein
LGFPTEILHAFLITPMCATCLVHLTPWFDYPNNIFKHTLMKLFIMQSSLASCNFHLCPNTLHSTLFSNTLNLCSSLSVRDQVSHPYKSIKINQAKLIQHNQVIFHWT